MARESVAQEEVAKVAGIRDIGVYELYDTFWIGIDAPKRDQNYKANFQELALEERILFFQGRKSPSLAWTNQNTERRDWAFDTSFMTAEMVVLYPALGNLVSNPLDSQFFPSLWTDMAKGFGVTIKLGDGADVIWESPLSHIPGGTQSTGLRYDSSSAPSVTPATQGLPDKRNFLAFPEPIKLAAGARMDVELRLADPIKSFLSNTLLPSPGYIEIPTEGGTIRTPQWYGIRIALHGTRAVQLRGARSAY